NGMLWIAHSGAQWRELPETYGPWQSVYARFAKWRDDGTLEAIFCALSADADSVHAVELLEKVKISGSNVLADRAYGSKTIRAYISEQGASYVIPPQGNVSDP
ncbi:MAG: transposase, partial [Oscillospiraceae bacterium]|nr:transposase [Oscillospiraceae bacterium]